jgi:hypothetical protein
VGLPHLGVFSGKYLFEVEVVEAKGWVDIGFVDSRYNGKALGCDSNDVLSWGIADDGKSRHG